MLGTDPLPPQPALARRLASAALGTHARRRRPQPHPQLPLCVHSQGLRRLHDPRLLPRARRRAAARRPRPSRDLAETSPRPSRDLAETWPRPRRDAARRPAARRCGTQGPRLPTTTRARLKVEPRPPYSSLLSLVSAWCAEVHPPVPPCASGRLPLVGTLPAEAAACVFVSLAAAAVAPKQRTVAVKAPPSHCPVPHARRGSAAL